MLRSATAPSRVALVVALLLIATVTGADDRELFFNSGEGPHMFVILDTSGSMNWALTGGYYPSGFSNASPRDSILPGAADDPRSRGYQAKSAIFEVVRDRLPEEVRIGFAHFAQPNATVSDKHWIYTPSEEPSWIADFAFPAPGQAIRFGEPPSDFATADGIALGSCASPEEGTTFELYGKLSQLPKLGRGGALETTVHGELDGTAYRVVFAPLTGGQTLGRDTLDIQVTLSRCDGTATPVTETITFEPFYQTDPATGLPIEGVSDYLAQDWNAFDLNDGDDDSNWDHEWDDPCELGWADNLYVATEDGALSYTSFADPEGRGDELARGDMIPWDWLEHPTLADPADGFELSTRDEFLKRLAPNIYVEQDPPLDEQGRPIPDFRVARYFQDTPVGGVLPLEPEYVDTPPIAFNESTPLARSLQRFAEWFDKWEPEAIDAEGARYQCRERWVVLLTDGVESCGGNPGAAAGALRDKGVRTIVVGFGPGADSGQLQAIADQGGTGTLDHYAKNDPTIERDCEEFVERDPVTGEPLEECTGPILAANRDDLVRALTRIFTRILDRPSSLSGAGLPAGSGEAANSLFLASFTPSEDRALWRGRLDHWVRPIEPADLADENPTPDCPPVSDEGRIEGCYAWNAGRQLLAQAPTDEELLDGELRIGFARDERRLLWSRPPAEPEAPALPRNVALFRLPEEQTARWNLWDGLGVEHVRMDAASEAAAATRTEEIIRETVRRKDDGDEEFILADIFHFTPTVVGAPSNLPMLLREPNRVEDCIGTDKEVIDPADLYGCYFSQNRYRRQVLLAGTNAGQLHAFDAGRFDLEAAEYGVGTGREIFSYMPSFALPRVRRLAEGSEQHEYSVDGSVTVADAKIDPDHDGVPDPDDRRWRTVVLGGGREGFRGVYALDLTRPDPIDVEDFDSASSLVWQILPTNTENVDTTPWLPGCMPSSGDSMAVNVGSGDQGDCESRPYPWVLWEFADLGLDGEPRDDDPEGSEGFGWPDLGNTWSQPKVAHVLVTENDEPVEKAVAIFGGGLDRRDGRPVGAVGNWLYMVDLETGQAIYKRRLEGAAPANAAVVDTDGDALDDAIYLGTTAGFLYKVDLSSPAEIVEDDLVPGGRVIEDSSWDPVAIFDTGGRPIYQEPSIFFIARRGLYAAAFGSGERDRIFDAQELDGRFYVVVDSDLAADPEDETEPPAPLTENDLARLEIDAQRQVIGDAGVDLRLPGSPGYYLVLEQDERAITKALTVGGITLFSTFLPNEVRAEDTTCITEGISRVYALFSFQGTELSETYGVYSTFRGVVAGVWTESGTFVPDEIGDPGEGPGDPNDGLSDEERQEALAEIHSGLMDNMSSRCRFSALTINMNIRLQDTGVALVAPIPVCQQIKNWYEL